MDEVTSLRKDIQHLNLDVKAAEHQASQAEQKAELLEKEVKKRKLEAQQQRTRAENLQGVLDKQNASHGDSGQDLTSTTGALFGEKIVGRLAIREQIERKAREAAEKQVSAVSAKLAAEERARVRDRKQLAAAERALRRSNAQVLSTQKKLSFEQERADKVKQTVRSSQNARAESLVVKKK